MPTAPDRNLAPVGNSTSRPRSTSSSTTPREMNHRLSEARQIPRPSASDTVSTSGRTLASPSETR